MMHDTVDIQRWIGMFPISESDTGVVSSVVSPYDVAIFEQARSKILGCRGSNPRKACCADVFVFGLGEPAERHLTKIGGLPYFADERQWPTNSSGEPMTFVAQLCFADSCDLVGDLPGDVLLVFGSQEENDDMECTWELSFEWMQLGQDDLVVQGNIPETDWKIVPCYGAIHRTCDYHPEGFGKSVKDRMMAVVGGTKIGGIPKWIGEPENLPGRFIGTIGSIEPSVGQPFPWLNVPEPIKTIADSAGQNWLSWNMLGMLYLFLEKDQIHWTTQSYLG